jgi:hypothetical protein
MQIDNVPWEQVGTNDPATHLLATIYVMGCPMHLEARQVGQNEDGQTFLEREGDYDALSRLYGVWDDFTTVMIDGREYILFAVPFCV